MDNRQRRYDKNHEFLKPNDSNLEVMQKISNLDPSYAKHMIHKNDIVAGLAKASGGGIDFLTQPICERCEKVATWDKDDTCHCFSCGHNTKKPMTVQDHFMESLKGIPPELLETLGNLAYQMKEEEQ